LSKRAAYSDKDIGRFLSLVLRHKPDALGITLDANGWTPIVDLLAKAQAAGYPLDEARLAHVIATNDKKRYSLSEDGSMIRAAQGHSVDIDLAMAPQRPPDVLYHGTAAKNLDSIMRAGLTPGTRQHVHLSLDIETATKVGARHGSPVVLLVDARRLHADGQTFWQSDNGVRLTEPVAPVYLTRLDDERG